MKNFKHAAQKNTITAIVVATVWLGLLSPIANAGNINISGYIAPTYIYSQAHGISTFALGNGISPFEYYSPNSAAGSIYLSANYSFSNGSYVQLAFIPNVSPDAPYYIAKFEVPIANHFSFIGGLIPTWNSYDSWSAVKLPTITRSLTVAYTIPAYMIGVGGKWSDNGEWLKFLVGNLNTGFQTQAKSPGLEISAGYPINKNLTVFNDFLYGQQYSTNSEHLGDILHDDLDASYRIGKATIGGNLFYEQWGHGAVNDKLAKDYGGEIMVNYNLTKKNIATVRYDYFDDVLNGGATDINGLQGGFSQKSPGVGPVRQEVTLADEYRINNELIAKVEYRYDWANGNTFGLYHNENDTSNGHNYGLTNHSSLVAVQFVYSF